MTLLFGLIVSIAFFIVAFISTNNLISSAAVGGVTLLYFAIYATRVLKNKNEKITRFQDCYQFVNNFLISLSIKGHISGALATALESQNEETIDLINSLETDDPLEKVKYLKNYFKFDMYYLFVDLVTLHTEEGGDIIKMSNNLLNQIRQNEEFLVNVERMNKNSIVEFTILWAFALSILAILKFALSDFFVHIVKNNFYQMSVIFVFAFALLSIHIAIRKVVDIDIKGWD
ncbi:MAG: hypothetical protein MJZ37_02550 [Bacilli bacterium]|nr:hypothetical protein [Bacilli bacterium]